MKVEKLERVYLDVKDLEQAEKFFSEALNIEFKRAPVDKAERKVMGYADRDFKDPDTEYVGVSISPIGLELIETSPPCKEEGVRSFHFKVQNLEEAMAHVEAKGVPLTTQFTFGNLKEAVYNPEYLSGTRMLLTEFQEPDAITSILEA